MIRSLALPVVAVILAADLALADPELRVSYPAGVPRVEIAGSYPQSSYTVWRRLPAEAAFTPLTNGDVLCLGPCYAIDPGAEPGQTYLYRFDLTLADGSRLSFGPYSVTIPADLARTMRASVWPNPVRGAARVLLFVGGSGGAVPAEARLFDLQGRVVSTLQSGPLARGLTTVPWRSRGDDGREIPAGLYLLRFSSSLGSTVTRVLTVR